ncbi:flavin reductase family protein [Dyella japonica]|nr:flavin reductase family protein [Dyella japonica]
MTEKNFHYYEPRLGHGLPHDPFSAIVGPRPIGWVSTRSVEGCINLAPYSFFNAFNYVPPIIGFASVGWKDSVRNIQATGQFVWNLATRGLAEAVNMTSIVAAPGVDEFKLAGLTHAPSTLVKPPRVAESPVNFECRLTQLIQLKGADETLVDTWLVLGEVVAVHIDKRLLVDGIYSTAASVPILRGGGPADYFAVDDSQRFQMFRPGKYKAPS